MTEGVLETKGTRLFFASPLAASSSDPDGFVILKVACATGISGLGGSKPQITTTCLESPEEESVPGRPSPGQVTVPFNAIFRSEAHQALIALNSGNSQVIGWQIVFSDQDGSPASVDSDGNLVSPGATTASFRGYVADLTFDVANNNIVTGNLVIQRSGAVGWNLPSADLP